MKDKLDEVSQEERSARLRRHQAQCSVCRHPQCQEIEEAWMNWGSTTLLADRYDLSRDGIYRHMRALDLFKERTKRRRLLLEKLLERGDTIRFSGADYLKAFQLFVALLEHEEAEQASALASQEVSSPMSDHKSEVLAEHGSLAEEGASDNLEGETGAPAVGDQQGEQGAAPVPSQDGQNVEPTTTVTVQ